MKKMTKSMLFKKIKLVELLQCHTLVTSEVLDMCARDLPT